MSFVSTLLGYIIFLGGIYLFLFKTDNAVLMVLGCLIFHSAAKERADSRSSFVKSRINRYKNLYKDAAKRFQQ